MKVSSLEGIRIGYVPFNGWQVSLTIGGISASSYVNLPGMVPTSGTFQYYSNLDENYNVHIYRGLGGATLGTEIAQFMPVDGVGDQITPFFTTYDSINEVCWVVANYGIFVYDVDGNLLNSVLNANLRNASYSVSAGVLLVVQNDSSAQNVLLYKWQNNAITLSATISDDKFGSPLTDIRAAGTDGETLIIVWYETGTSQFYCTSYSYPGLAGQNQGPLDNANITNPSGVIVNTVDNSFVVVNNSYNELEQLGGNVNQPYVSGTDPIELVNIGTSQTILPVVGLNIPSTAAYSLVSFDNSSGGSVFAVCKQLNYESYYQTGLLWDNISATTWLPSQIASSKIGRAHV